MWTASQSQFSDAVAAFKHVSRTKTGLLVFTGLLVGLIPIMVLKNRTICWWTGCQIPFLSLNVDSYFNSFRGFDECQVRMSDLYTTPEQDRRGFHKPGIFCRNREMLLQAMSDGGRIGFDAPYTPRACHHQWFSPPEICFILERFENVVFIGDEFLHTIYAGLNILLRQDLLHGALDLSRMSTELQAQCRCANQFTKQECCSHHIKGSTLSSAKNPHTGYPALCPHTRHAYLSIDSTTQSPALTKRFEQLIPKAPRSHYHPIPIIHSLSPSTFSTPDAKASLLNILELADASGRKTPMLWLGPTAAGHLEIKGRKGNQEIWDFDRAMVNTARENDIERLGMWNLTVQASSFDGVRFGEKVAITQAMMVVNWLARLEGS